MYHISKIEFKGSNPLFWMSDIEDIKTEFKELKSYLFHTKLDVLEWFERYCIDNDIIISDFEIEVSIK